MALTALITRPQEDAEPLAAALAAREIATLIEPLLTITPLPATAAPLAEDLAEGPAGHELQRAAESCEPANVHAQVGVGDQPQAEPLARAQ